MGKKLKFSVAVVLLVVFISDVESLVYSQIPRQHKVRHKHNFLQFDDHKVNEIREAFDEYKHTIQNPKSPRVSFDDAIKLKSLRHHRRDDEKLNDSLTASANENRVEMTRYKRVHDENTSQGRKMDNLSDNYDEEYDDGDVERVKTRVADSSVPKVQETKTAGEALTNHKLDTLGTREGVQKSFDREVLNQRHNQQEITNNYDRATIFKNIRENMERTKKDGRCQWPHKKVIEMPHHASKVYNPRKYVIHQCSDDTACCGSLDKTCIAKKTEEVVLWFHVRNVGSSGYESLRVQNHTECQCMYKDRLFSSATRLNAGSRVVDYLPNTTTKQPARQCRCPIYFEADFINGHCSCSCKTQKHSCRKRHEGKEGFTMSDQRCIKEQVCPQPHCMYGSYSAVHGRCPDRHEKMRKGFTRSVIF